MTEQGRPVCLSSVTENADDRLIGSCLKSLIALKKVSMMAAQKMLSKSSRRIYFAAEMAMHIVDWEGSRDVGSSLRLEEKEPESHRVKHFMDVAFPNVDPKVRWAVAFVPTKSADIRTVACLVPF